GGGVIPPSRPGHRTPAAASVPDETRGRPSTWPLDYGRRVTLTHSAAGQYRRDATQCGSGGTGRRAGLRSLWGQPRGGSNPYFRTRKIVLGPQCGLGTIFLCALGN